MMATDPMKESHRLKLPSGQRLIYCPVLTPLWQDGSWGAKLLTAHSCCTERNDVCALERSPIPIKKKDLFFHTQPPVPLSGLILPNPPQTHSNPKPRRVFSSKRKLYFIQGKAN